MVCVIMSSIQFVLARHTGIFDQDLFVEIHTLESSSFLMLAGRVCMSCLLSSMASHRYAFIAFDNVYSCYV